MAKKKAKKASAKSKAPAKKVMSKKSPSKAKKNVSTKSTSASPSQSSVGSSRPKWIPPGANSLSPIFILKNVEAALDFYQKAFGFKLKNVMRGPDNSILHAEMTHVDSHIMMGPESHSGVHLPQLGQARLLCIS